MNRFRSGLVPLFAVLAVVGCSSEPTGDLRDTPPEMQASPDSAVPRGRRDQGGDRRGRGRAGESPRLHLRGYRDGHRHQCPPRLELPADLRGRQHPAGARDRATVQVPGDGLGLYLHLVQGEAAGAEERSRSPCRSSRRRASPARSTMPTPALGDTITLTAAPGTAFADTAQLRLPGVPDTHSDPPDHRGPRRRGHLAQLHRAAQRERAPHHHRGDLGFRAGPGVLAGHRSDPADAADRHGGRELLHHLGADSVRR